MGLELSGKNKSLFFIGKAFTTPPPFYVALRKKEEKKHGT